MTATGDTLLPRATMVFLSPATAKVNAVEPTRGTTRAEAELARLHAQVARLQAEREALRWAACHDELTGLPNRRLFLELAPSLIGRHTHSAVVIADLDHFKPINDRFGHQIGDEVLRIIAHRLANCVGGDLVARLGGDEFAGVLTSPDWRPVVAAIARAVAEPMTVSGQSLAVTASIGVTPADGSVPIDQLLHRADAAMYEAKRDYARGGSIPTYDPHTPDAVSVAPASTYRKGDPVWVHRDSAWRPGTVVATSTMAVMCRYRRAEGLGTVVDTMSAEFVFPRADTDPHLDGIPAQAA